MTDERSKTDVSSDEVIRKYFDTVYKRLAHSCDDKLLKECFYVIVVQENRSA